MTERPDRLLVIGLGNEHRHDDRCGLDVVRALQARPGLDVRIVEGGDDATTLLDLWEGVARVIVVDGMRSGRPPGTLLRFEVDPAEPPAPIPVTSTHGLSLNEAIGLGRALGRLPHGLVVIGIELSDLSPGSGLSPAVAESVPAAVDRVLAEIDGRDGGLRA